LEPSPNGYGIELAGVQVGDPFGTPTSELASGFSGVLGTQITIYIKASSGAEITDGQRAYILGLNQSGVFDLTVGDIRINNSQGTSIAVAGIDGATLVPSLDVSGDETGVYQVSLIPSVLINDSRMISSDYVEVGGFPIGGYHEDILATAQELHPDVQLQNSEEDLVLTTPWRGAGPYDAPDGTVPYALFDSLGEGVNPPITTGIAIAPSGAAAMQVNLTAPDAILVSSDGLFTDSAVSNQEYEHPDVVVEDSGANSESFPWRGPGSYEVSNTEQKHTDGTSFSTPRTGPALADKNLPTIIITDSTNGDAELYNGGSQGGTYDGVADSLTFSVTPAGGAAPLLNKSVALFETNAHLRGTGASFFSPGASDAFSICMFFKPLEELTGNKYYGFITNRYTVSGSPGFQVRYENLIDNLVFQMQDTSGNLNRIDYDVSGGIAINLWNSLVLTKSGLDASTYNVYLNGTLLTPTITLNNLTALSNTASVAELTVNALQTSSGVLNNAIGVEKVSYAQILLVDKALNQTEVNEYHDDSGVDMSFAADILHSFASDDTDMVHPTLTDSITGTETLTIINGPNALDNNDEP
jgi:hypothetical protein